VSAISAKFNSSISLWEIDKCMNEFNKERFNSIFTINRIDGDDITWNFKCSRVKHINFNIVMVSDREIKWTHQRGNDFPMWVQESFVAAICDELGGIIREYASNELFSRKYPTYRSWIDDFCHSVGKRKMAKVHIRNMAYSYIPQSAVDIIDNEQLTGSV